MFSSSSTCSLGHRGMGHPVMSIFAVGMISISTGISRFHLWSERLLMLTRGLGNCDDDTVIPVAAKPAKTPR